MIFPFAVVKEACGGVTGEAAAEVSGLWHAMSVEMRAQRKIMEGGSLLGQSDLSVVIVNSLYTTKTLSLATLLYNYIPGNRAGGNSGRYFLEDGKKRTLGGKGGADPAPI